MCDTFSKVEVITGVAIRRRFSTDLKLAMVAETLVNDAAAHRCTECPRCRAEPEIVLRPVVRTRSTTQRPSSNGLSVPKSSYGPYCNIPGIADAGQ